MQASGVEDLISTRPEIHLILKVTAYSSEPSQTDSTPFEAAWGHRVHDGMIAVSRDLEALGLTRWLARFELIDRYVWFYPTLEIDGREFIIKDRLHERKREQLDIWMASTEDALEWGVQYKTVKVINCSNLIIFDLIRFDDCLQLADINQQFSG